MSVREGNMNKTGVTGKTCTICRLSTVSGTASAGNAQSSAAPAGVGLHVDAPVLWVQAVRRQGTRLAQVLHAVNDLVATIVPEHTGRLWNETARQQRSGQIVSRQVNAAKVQKAVQTTLAMLP